MSNRLIDIPYTLSMLMLLAAPPVSYVALQLPSMTGGLLLGAVATLAVVVASGTRLKVPRVTPIAGILFGLASVIALIGSADAEPDKLIAIISLMFLFVIAGNFARMMMVIAPPPLRRSMLAIAYLCCISIICGAFLRLNPGNYANFPASVFPFAEPSHLAIFCGPLLALGYFLGGTVSRWIIFTCIVIGAVTLPSLMLAIHALLSVGLLLTAKLRRPAIVLLLVPPAAIALIWIYPTLLQYVDLSYFAERTSVQDTRNVSLLVYLQGWERAWLALRDTGGLGVGFQNFAEADVGQYGFLAMQMAGSAKNLKDGGFTAAPLIGEFGIVGLLLLVMYLREFVRASFELTRQLPALARRRIASTDWRRERWTLLLFFANVVTVYAVMDLFFRGVGYFSMSFFLLAVAYCIRTGSSQAARSFRNATTAA